MLTFITEPKMLLWSYETLIELYVETEEFEKAIEYSNKMLEVQGSDKFKIRNDIAMFNKCDIKIAMGNANETIKRMATHITKSVDECGVCYAIEEILNI